MLIWYIPKENNNVSDKEIEQSKINRISAITYSNALSYF